MKNSKKPDLIVRYIAGSLLLLLSLNAFAGGWYGMAGAKNIPIEWLAGSPFHSYFIPALFLFSMVGGSCMAACIAVFRNHSWAPRLAKGASLLLLAWISVQVVIIGYVSWMQPAVGLIAITILLMSRLLYRNQISTKQM